MCNVRRMWVGLVTMLVLVAAPAAAGQTTRRLKVEQRHRLHQGGRDRAEARHGPTGRGRRPVPGRAGDPRRRLARREQEGHARRRWPSSPGTVTSRSRPQYRFCPKDLSRRRSMTSRPRSDGSRRMRRSTGSTRAHRRGGVLGRRAPRADARRHRAHGRPGGRRPRRARPTPGSRRSSITSARPTWPPPTSPTSPGPGQGLPRRHPPRRSPRSPPRRRH